MTSYKVQVYLGKTADWETIASFKPDYRLGLMRLGQWWKPQWLKRLVGVASNFEPAEKKALAQATLVAKRAMQPLLRLESWSIRVMRESTWTGREVKDLMWLDGKRKLKLKTIFKRKLHAAAR